MDQQGRHDVDQRFSEAQGFLDRKEYQRALDAFGELVRLHPDRAMFMDHNIDCLLRLSRWREAQEVLSAAIESHGKNVFRINQLARTAIELQDYSSALDILRSCRHELKLNANFFIFMTISAVGAGDFDQACEGACEVLSFVDDSEPSPLHRLAAHLRRLASKGHAEGVLQLVEYLLPLTTDPKCLLETGMSTAAMIGRWPKHLVFASELVRQQPDVIGNHIQQLTGRFECGDEASLEELRALDARFPREERTSEDSRRIENLEYQAQSRPLWRSHLQREISDTFDGFNTRIAAYLTLRQFDRAIEQALSAIAAYREHPRFMMLLGKAHEAKGSINTALEWLTRAIKKSPETSYLLYLARLQTKAGLTESASATVRLLLREHPKLPGACHLANQLGIDDDHPVAPLRRMQERDTWLHGGDSGDLIYALAAMQAGGGGHLFLTSVDGTREPMTSAKIEFLEPLLRLQMYIGGISVWQGEPIVRDFSLLRHVWVPGFDLVTLQWRCVLDNPEPDVRTRWLDVPNSPKHGRPVFARSNRYTNPEWDLLWRELKASTPDAIFVGTPDEFDLFQHGEHYPAHNALDLAQIISGASVFVGNQSLPYAIAEGLKVARILEVSPSNPNCIFPGALPLRFQTASIVDSL